MVEIGDYEAQAVELLRRRQEALVADLARVNADLTRVSAALMALGINDAEGAEDEVALEDEQPEPDGDDASLSSADQPPAVSIGGGGDLTVGKDVTGRTGSVRGLVEDVLESVDRWFSTDEINTVVLNAYRGSGKSENKIKANIRSSMWSLRKNGLAESRNDNREHRATKWSTDAETASAPTETVSEPNPTSSREGGEASHGTESHPDRDLHPSREEVDRDQGLGAPVMGAHSQGEPTTAQASSV